MFSTTKSNVSDGVANDGRVDTLIDGRFNLFLATLLNEDLVIIFQKKLHKRRAIGAQFIVSVSIVGEYSGLRVKGSSAKVVRSS